MTGSRLSQDDRAEIIDTCMLFHWYYDQKDWTALGRQLSPVVSMPTLEEIESDPAFDPNGYVGRYRRTRADVTNGLSQFAEGLITQHLIAGYRVIGAADAAVCYAHGINVHFRQLQPTQAPLWHGNSYRFDLVRSDGIWLIAGVVPRIIWSWGNESGHDVLAKQRAWLDHVEPTG